MSVRRTPLNKLVDSYDLTFDRVCELYGLDQSTITDEELWVFWAFQQRLVDNGAIPAENAIELPRDLQARVDSYIPSRAQAHLCPSED